MLPLKDPPVVVDYVCITFTMRYPARFHDSTFVQAVNKVLREKIHCDPNEEGLVSYTTAPDYQKDPAPPCVFDFREGRFFIRAERGKVPLAKLRDSIEKYLYDVVKFTRDEASVSELTTSPYALHSEL